MGRVLRSADGREGTDIGLGETVEHRTHPTPDGQSVALPRRLLRRGRRLVVAILLTYLGVSLLAAIFQKHLIYFPTDDYWGAPAGVGLDFEELTLEASDGVVIAAWFVPQPQANATVLFCHGNAGNISDRLHSIQVLHELGYNVLIFDYRGFGRSTGSPSESGTYLDADAAWRWLVETRGEPAERVVILGRSLGGAVAIELAGRHPPAALVVESTFTSLADIGQHHYRLLPVRLLLKHRYESIDKVSKITCPKLFLHGTDDRLIPLVNGRRLYEAATAPKQFVETPGGHNTAGFTHSPTYAKRLAAFIDEALNGSVR